ncbi:MAG: glycosyltransferase family 4 protein [Planctomycetota bacterium]|nr:glycosyltransferase family 4 protein [Planctomycetota bacterium]
MAYFELSDIASKMTCIRRCSFGAPHQTFASKITGPFGVIAMSHPIVRTGRRDDIPQVLCSLDILVSLSGGSVMFEAMSCGKAVISAGFSTKEDSVHIQDGRTGLLVSSGYPSDLARAMV